MTASRRVILPALTLTISVVFAAAAISLARAESVVWSGIQPDLVSAPIKGQSIAIYDPMVSVTYNVRVSEVNANGVKLRTLPSGATVPVGTRVLYEFVPHIYTDIYWFGTGARWDSPYGDWVANAVAPPMSQRCTEKNKYYEIDARRSTDGHALYAALSVAPPSKTVSVNITSCSDAPNGGKLCEVTSPGSTQAVFSFASTKGHFYPGLNSEDDGRYVSSCNNISSRIEDVPMNITYVNNQKNSEKNRGVFTLQVPTQSITHTLTATAADTGSAPSKPNLSIVGNGSCVVGEPHAISMRATDPGDQVRFGIDWDNNGTIDQFAPTSGYVPSGSSQTVFRTFETPGLKVVRVLAQDQGGLTSEFATITFSCSNPPQEGATGFRLNEGDGFSGRRGAGAAVSPTLSLRVLPSLVRAGTPVRVHWSAENAEACSVSGTNGDQWSGIESRVGGEDSRAITETTDYTLTCTDIAGNPHTRSARVTIIPVFVEP